MPPDRGLYTAVIAGFLISALGGSRVQIGGPTGAFVVIVYGIVQRYGVDGLLAATLMAGVILLILGLATRWVSLLFAIQMLVTTLLVKLPNAGFIAPQDQPGAGAELDLLLLAAALVLLAFGPGQLSVERNVLRREL